VSSARPQVTQCPPAGQVLTMDARNHGSSPHSPLMTYEAMSVDVQHLLAHLGIHKCILVGHSMGGKTAMVLALQRVGVWGLLAVGWGSESVGGGTGRGSADAATSPR